MQYLFTAGGGVVTEVVDSCFYAVFLLKIVKLTDK